MTDPKQINQIFRDFYRELCSDHPDPSSLDRGKAFLDQVKLPAIKDDQMEFLNSRITEEQVQLTIRGLGTGKASGPDGFSANFF